MLNWLLMSNVDSKIVSTLGAVVDLIITLKQLEKWLNQILSVVLSAAMD